ncbi:MAG: glycosyltransferase family 1 protein, partial [candidate division NC10 bacterium]
MTGIGSYLRVLLEHLAAQHPDTLVTAIIGADATAIPSDIVAHVHRLPKAPTLICDQFFIPRALKCLKADVFFSPYYKTPMFAPCPKVATVHDLIPVQFSDYLQGSGRLHAVAFRAWAGFLARMATAVVTDSEFSKSQLRRLLRLPAKRIHVIPIGLPSDFSPSGSRQNQQTALSRYGIHPPYLLTVGNFLPHKNLPRLAEAYAGLPASLRETTSLVLAGTPGGHGPARPVSREILRRPGVVFPGFIAPEDLPSFYAGATALVFPSLVEGFGLPVLEAMACGTPVVCARAGSLPEVAGDAALYVGPLDVESIRTALRRVIEEGALRHGFGARGRARQCGRAPRARACNGGFTGGAAFGQGFVHLVLMNPEFHSLAAQGFGRFGMAGAILAPDLEVAAEGGAQVFGFPDGLEILHNG